MVAQATQAGEVLGQVEPAPAAHPGFDEGVVRIERIDAPAAALATADAPEHAQHTFVDDTHR